MKRLGSAVIISRPFLRRLVQLTDKVFLARVMPTYIKRRSSSRRVTKLSLVCSLPASLSIRNGSMPSVTPMSMTCGHSKPLAAWSVESVTTFWSFSRSFKVDSKAMVCATSSKFFCSDAIVAPAVSSISPPQRWAIQSQNSITCVQRAAAICGLSSAS